MTERAVAGVQAPERYPLRNVEDYPPYVMYALGFLSSVGVLIFFDPPLSEPLWIAFIVIQFVIPFADAAVSRDRPAHLEVIRMGPPLFFQVSMLLNTHSLFWRIAFGLGAFITIARPVFSQDGYAEIRTETLILKGAFRSRTFPLSQIEAVESVEPPRWPSSLAPTVIIEMARRPGQLWPWRHKVRLNVAMEQADDFIRALARQAGLAQTAYV